MTDKKATEDSTPEPRTPADFCVVGIGASAGGVEAIEKLCQNLGAEPGMAFVVVLHRDPAADDILSEVLRRHCNLSLQLIEDGQKPLVNHVYIAPNDHFVSIVRGVFRTYPPDQGERLRMPIDFFFRSLAQSLGEKAIGIVLSGAGTDGALGLKAIKSAGGLTIAQNKHDAQYDSMPHNAIATGSVDLMLDADKIGEELDRYLKHPYVAQAPTATPATRASDLMERIFSLLRTHTGHDFSHYKRNTITRRIERRMAVHQIGKLGEYVRYLTHNPREIDSLFKELLINVTSFFRDPESFEALAREVLPNILRACAKSGPVRCWVPGCSTGEEAYSLAITLIETADALGIACEAQIFATDIDNASLEAARHGVYPESIEPDVGKDRLQRFFIREGGAFRVNKRVRDMVIVAKQDLIRDPPFSKLDLVVCRNLLIYLNPTLQKKVLPLFHYTLNPRGVLMLGPSETVGEYTHLFSIIDKRWRIFERTHAPRNNVDFPTTPLLSDVSAETRMRNGVAATKTIAHAAEKALLEQYAPSCVIVNEKYDIVHFHGRTSRYLEPPTGEPSLNVLKMAREELRIELRTVLHKVFNTGQAERRSAIRIKVEGQHELVNLIVQPFPDSESSRGLVMVVFEQTQQSDDNTAPAAPHEPQFDQRVFDLEYELNSTKESLQTTIEELETSNEELKSTNEELQSTNEELQSTNEELETSKEELQSINEELITVNSELQSKLDELSQINNDVVNLLAATDVATIFLDNSLRIKRFTPNVTSIMNLITSDLGRHISDIAPKLVYDDVARDAEQVLQTLVFRQREVQARLGGWYSMRIMPYRTLDNVIDGVVLTFANITEMHKQRQQAESAQQYAERLIALLPHPVLVIDRLGKIVALNDAWLRALHWPNHDLGGQLVFGLIERSEDISTLQKFLESDISETRIALGIHAAHAKAPAIETLARRLKLDAPLEPPGESELIVLTAEGSSA